jgi:hypothetical protein
MYYYHGIETHAGFAAPSRAQFDFCLAYLEHFKKPKDLQIADVVLSAFLSHEEVELDFLRYVDAMMPRFVGKYEILPF